MSHEENEAGLGSAEGLKRLAAVEDLFTPWTRDNPDLAGLALVSWSDRTVRLTSKGRDFYRPACELSGIAPRAVRTLDQLQMVRRMDAELMLQRLMDAELQAWEGRTCI